MMRRKKVVALSVAVLAVVLVLCWLVVPGGWVAGVDQLTTDSVVTASRYQHMDEEDADQITLTQQQTQKLRQLLERTVFFRRVTGGIRSQKELTHYDFTITPGEGGDPVYVRCTFGSGAFVSISEKGTNTELRVIFSDLEEQLSGLFS